MTNKTDDMGWNIPREGSRSRQIYDRLKAGKTSQEIRKEVGGTQNNVAVLIHRIQHPEYHRVAQRHYNANQKWVYMNGHSCLSCAKGVYAGYDGNGKTNPCPCCGDQQYVRLNERAFNKTIKERDNRPAAKVKQA